MENPPDKSIIVTLNSFWTTGKGMSGGDQIAKQVFARLSSKFSQIYILTSQRGFELFNEIPNATHIKYLFNCDKFGLGISYLYRTVAGVFKINMLDSSIIYAGSDFFTDTIPAFIYKLTHRRAKWYQAVFHIYPQWKTRPGSKTKAFLGYYLQKFSHCLAKKADEVICINTQVKQELVKSGFDENKLVLIHPGIDYNMLAEVKKAPQTYEATFLARLNPSKGIYDLPKIWSLVCKDMPKAKLAIIGGGSQDTICALNQELSKYNLNENIQILGYLENERAFGLIKSSKCFLFPSHEEGFGIAIAEAMACGTPVVAWNLPVYSEVFGNKIVQVQENDSDKFAQEAVRLLENPPFRDKISQEGIEYIKRHSWDSVAELYLKCLGKI